jgi:anti-anti-sigma factor
MEISIRQQARAIVVVLKGRMDAVSAPMFESTLADHMAAGASRVVVDCEALEYISSAGLRSLLSTARTLRTRHGELAFAGIKDMVREVFEITGFATMFTIYDSTEAALAQR